MTQNLQFVFNGNLFSREYFAFMQRLMDSTPGGAGGPARKSQRRGERGGPRAAVNQKSDVDSMEDGAGGGRRTRTPEEEDALVKGVQRYGVGKWADIKADWPNIFK